MAYILRVNPLIYIRNKFTTLFEQRSEVPDFIQIKDEVVHKIIRPLFERQESEVTSDISAKRQEVGPTKLPNCRKTNLKADISFSHFLYPPLFIRTKYF